MVALSEHYGVSRKTLYKWLARYQEHGTAGWAERSRAPPHSPQGIRQEAIVQARQRWKGDPRKLLAKLEQTQPEGDWLAASTVADLLRREGLSQAPKKRPRTPPQRRPFTQITQPNQTWCADFKGWFLTGDRARCDPLTLTDAHRRYRLRCQIVPNTDTVPVRAIFEAAFREYRLPEVITPITERRLQVQSGSRGPGPIIDAVGEARPLSRAQPARHAAG